MKIILSIFIALLLLYILALFLSAPAQFIQELSATLDEKFIQPFRDIINLF